MLHYSSPDLQGDARFPIRGLNSGLRCVRLAVPRPPGMRSRSSQMPMDLCRRILRTRARVLGSLLCRLRRPVKYGELLCEAMFRWGKKKCMRWYRWPRSLDIRQPLQSHMLSLFQIKQSCSVATAPPRSQQPCATFPPKVYMATNHAVRVSMLGVSYQVLRSINFVKLERWSAFSF